MAALGAKVLHPRSVELAMAWNVQVQVLSSFWNKNRKWSSGNNYCREDNIVEKQIVNGVTYTRNESKITLLSVSDMPVSLLPFCAFGGRELMLMWSSRMFPWWKNNRYDIYSAKIWCHKSKTLLEKLDFLADTEIRIVNNIAKISIIGIWMSSHTSVAKTMFTTLAENKINIQAITTSEIKVSVLIDEKFTELAVRALHSAFGLDQKRSDIMADDHNSKKNI